MVSLKLLQRNLNRFTRSIIEGDCPDPDALEF